MHSKKTNKQTKQNKQKKQNKTKQNKTNKQTKQTKTKQSIQFCAKMTDKLGYFMTSRLLYHSVQRFRLMSREWLSQTAKQ